MGSAVELRPYQLEALEAIVAGLSGGGRGQLISACGTGKTRIAWEVVRRLCPPDGLVMLAAPSLTLVAQTVAAWTKSHQEVASVLAVCSDDTVTDSATRTVDLLCAVTTDPETAARWLAEDCRGRRLLVCTYASAGVAVDGLRKAGIVADVLVCDEAHHTAGAEGKRAAVLHDDVLTPTRARLYMTATPKVLAGRPNASTEHWVSMDDTTVFGPVLYDYPASRAIAEGWLDDYRVVVIGVTREETLYSLRRAGFEEDSSNPDGAAVRRVVVQTALGIAASKYGLRRVISYHRTIAEAKTFAETLPQVVSLLPSDRRPSGSLYSAHVSGAMSAADRQEALDCLATPPGGGWAVLSNARALTEGVDVPQVDGVVFTSPHKSIIQVVQAVGRALRSSSHTQQTSTVLVPLLLPDDPQDLDTPDAAYEVLWQVLRALRAHDRRLAAELDSRRSRSNTDADAQSAGEPPAQVVYDFPASYRMPGFRDHLTIRAVKATTSPWWEGFGALQTYVAEHGNAAVPSKYVTAGGFPLGKWVVSQRTDVRSGQIPEERRERLNKLGMIWNTRVAAWERGYEALQAYVVEHGNAAVPRGYVTADGLPLDTWVKVQRHDPEEMPEDRRERLNKLGMIWNTYEDAWERGFTALEAYVVEHGNAAVPRGYVTADALPLYSWVKAQRRDREKMSEERRERLNKLGMIWSIHEDAWERGFAALQAYVAEHGNAGVRDGYVAADGLRLASWVRTQRDDREKMSEERRERLNKLGMIWNVYEDMWERGLAALQAYAAEHGTCKVRRGYVTADGLRLYSWVASQRARRRQGQMSTDQADRLAKIGLFLDV